MKNSISPAVASSRKRGLEVIRGRLKRVVRGKFIDSLSGVDELRDRRRRLEVRDALRLHDVFDGVCVLDEGDDAHLSFILGALERVDLIDALYARGPTTLTKLLPVITFVLLGWRKTEVSAFPPSRG